MLLLKKPIIIGIAGGSASGKSSVARQLYEEYKQTNSVTIIKEDDYYKDQSNLSFDERCKTNYDHPFAFDHDLLKQQLIELMKGNVVNKPTYDYTQHNRSEIVEVVEPTDVIIIEGLFVLENKDIRDMLDIKLFIDTPADVRFIRRMKRDISERGRELDGIINQYLTTVRPMHEEFVEPSKKYADLIIPEGKSNTVAIDIVSTKINSILTEKLV